MYKIVLLFLLSQVYALPDENPEPKLKPDDQNFRVVGGTVAGDGKYPYQVSLRNNTNFHFCGGSILAEKWILTAAHCTVGIPAWYLHAIVGTNKLNQGGVRYNVEKIINHKFERATFKNDISILKLKMKIVFNARIKHIALPIMDTGAGKNVVLTGWGRTSEPGTAPNQLQKINLTTLSVDRCKKDQKSLPIYSSQICTFTKIGQGACKGDSGGPLVEGNRLVGVVSWGNPCAVGRPDVFTRVWHFKTWIENQMEK